MTYEATVRARQGGKVSGLAELVPRYLEATRERLLVVAPSYEEFRAWLGTCGRGVNPHLIRYVGRPQDLHGWMNPRYVLVNDWPSPAVRNHMAIVGGVCVMVFYT